jgi:hypothetical protein
VPHLPVRARASFAAPADEVEQAKVRALANYSMSPSVHAAAVIEPFSKGTFGEQDLWALREELKGFMEQLNTGDMSRCENMLLGQAVALEQIFVHMSRRILGQQFQRHTEAYFAMALKAQAQCRTTIETLNEIKHPRQPSTFVRAGQANIASGPQQVNNGAHPTDDGTRARESESGIKPNKLLESTCEERLDTPAAGAASRRDTSMETVAAINGTADGCRQAEGRS